MLERHPILVYTIARIGLFFLAAGALHVAGARGLMLVVMAFLVSALLSLILLSGPRDGFSRKVAGYFDRINRRIDEAARAEDDELDARQVGRSEPESAESGGPTAR